MKLRLLLFKECNRKCKGCCNQYWDTDKLPVCESFKGYDEVILTGGEPMLKPDLVLAIVKRIREENPNARVYMYTALLRSPKIEEVIEALDGITFTIHAQEDVKESAFLMWVLGKAFGRRKSMRLYLFEGVDTNKTPLDNWEIRNNMKWRTDCPLPEGEVLMRL